MVARDGFTANITRVTRQALDHPDLTRSKFQRDPERPRPLDSFAWDRSQGFEGAERLAHDAAAALSQGEQALTDVGQVLLQREASNGAALEIRPGCVGAKQLALDMDGEIADPAGHPDEVLVRAYRPVDQHDGRRPRAVLVPEPPSQIEEHDGKVLVDAVFSAHPVDQKPTVLKACQYTIDLLRLALMPEPLHAPEHGHGVVLESLDDRRPFQLSLLQSLLDLSQGPLLLGRELDDGLRELVDGMVLRER